MEKLTVRGFGPIVDCSLGINDFMVLIGPQASGKSTICKIVYYCKSLRDDFLRIVLESFESGDFSKTMSQYMQYSRSKFLNFFGPTMHLDNIYINYEYSQRMYIEISLEKTHKYVNHNFCQEMYNELKDLILIAKNYHNELSNSKTLFSDVFGAEKIAYDSYKKTIYQNIIDKINYIFSDDREYIYIPAGRSLITTLTSSLNSLFKEKDVYDREVDYITKAFIEKILNLKTNLVSLDQLLSEKKAILNKDIPHEYVNEAYKTISKVIGGRYINESGVEKIALDNSSKFVKLNFASSGQQESIWILNLLYWYIVYKRKCHIIIEEPESHLFPTAQVDMLNLISTFFNSSNNRVIIPTHSPYVLAAVNNLTYAYQIGSQQDSLSEVNQVVNKTAWLDNKRLGVYKMDNGKLVNIFDNIETGLIDIKPLDRAASIPINETFEKLIDLEDKYGRCNMEN